MRITRVFTSLTLIVVSMMFAVAVGSPLTDPLDKQLVVIVGHTNFTDSVYDSVIRGLGYLPASTKRFFVDGGVTIVIAPTTNDVTGRNGRSEYDPVGKRAIITEVNTDGTAADLRRLHITTLHELGHANDQLLGYPSRSAAFIDAYNQEASQVPQEYQGILSHFLLPGQAGSRECFASLFACLYYKGDDRRLTALKASFPQTFAVVQALRN